MELEPMRIFDGTARPHEPFWRVRDAVEGGEPEIEFSGYISEYSWFEDDITPKLFRQALEETGQGGPVTVRINSSGGDVFAASAIRSMLVDYPGRVTARIDGLCASAATFVALGADHVRMQDTAFFMIHDPSAMVWGSIEEVKAGLEMLKTVKAGILSAYQDKTGLDAERLGRMMTAETWLTAQEAQELGFVDEVIGGPVGVGARNVAILNAVAVKRAVRDYRNVPEALKAVLDTEYSGAVTQATPNQAAAELRRYLSVFG